MRFMILPVLLGLALAFLSGCAPDIGGVAPGMGRNQVELHMGPPLEILRGDATDADKVTYVYRDGSVHFKLNRVYMVERKGGEKTISEKIREQELREKSRY